MWLMAGEVSVTSRRHSRVGEFKEARGLLQHQEVLGHGKTSNTCGSVDFCSLVSNSSCACFNWQAIQATNRL